ncbi:MAG: PIN-like domain-containing protein [Rhodoplanes sp.]
MNVLIDENLPPRLATTLDGFIREDGHGASSLRDKYGPGVRDETWIADLGRDADDWIVISGDSAHYARPRDPNRVPLVRTARILSRQWLAALAQAA